MHLKIIAASALACLAVIPAVGIAAPEPPGRVSTKTVNDVIEIAWVPSRSDPLIITGYEVARSPFISGPYQPVCVTLKGAGSCLDRKAQPEKTYYYKVRALGIGDEGHSMYTTEVTGALPPAPPVEKDLWRKPVTPPVN